MASPNDRDYARLGMAISLKATGKAVVRNRVKRLVREYFRTHQGDLPAVDVVFIARQAVCSSSSSDLSASLDWHFRQIKKHAQHSPASD